MASCCTWDKSMVDSDCFPKTLGSCVRGACVLCIAIRSRDATGAVLATATHHFGNFVLGTPFRKAGSMGISVYLVEARPWINNGHQDAAASRLALEQQLPQSSPPVPPGEPLDDSPLPNCPIRDAVLTDRDKQLLSDLRRDSGMALPREWSLATPRQRRKSRRSHEQTPVLGSTSSLPLSLAPCCSDWPGPGSAEFWAAAQNNREDATAEGRTAWEASLCLDSSRLHQQSHEGTGWRCCAGFSGLCRNWTTALIPQSSGIGTHPTSAECVEPARIAWEGGRYKRARSAMREQGRSKTGVPSLPHVKLSPMSAPCPAGERQEHLAEQAPVPGP